ncbi:MAG: hypothetical protein WCB31_01355, partial [Nitrososphaeraceae archaeon]
MSKNLFLIYTNSIVFVEKEKIIKTSLIIILFSFFLLIVVTTYFINENLVFSQQNKYKDPKSVNQENAADVHKVEIKHQQENFSNFDIFGIKEIYPTKKNGFEW